MARSLSARLMPSSMVWPRTNCCPRIFMAWPTAVRTRGSPRRLISRRAPAAGLEGSEPSTRPVSISAQVEALTSGEKEFPRCALQFDGAILSSIRSSIVSASGTRRSASARHISPTPSSVDRPYSSRNASIMVGLVSSLTRWMSCAAAPQTAWRRAAERPRSSASSRTAWASSSAYADRIAARVALLAANIECAFAFIALPLSFATALS